MDKAAHKVVAAMLSGALLLPLPAVAAEVHQEEFARTPLYAIAEKWGPYFRIPFSVFQCRY